MKLFVGNLPFDLTEDVLNSTFAAFGQVTSAKLIMNRDTGRPKGFGFVEMPNNEEANAAIAKLNNSEVGGRKMVVNEARPMEPRSGGFGGGGRGGGGGGRGGRDGGGGRKW